MTIILLLVAALPISQLAGQPYETKRRKRRRRSPCQSSFWPSSKTAVGAKLPVTILKVFFFFLLLFGRTQCEEPKLGRGTQDETG